MRRNTPLHSEHAYLLLHTPAHLYRPFTGQRQHVRGGSTTGQVLALRERIINVHRCGSEVTSTRGAGASEVKSQRKASVAARASDGRKQSLFAGFSADLLGKPKKTAGFAKVRAAVRMSHAEDEAKPAASSSM